MKIRLKNWYLSSAAIYGDCGLNPIKEEYRGVIQSYAVSKLQAARSA